MKRYSRSQVSRWVDMAVCEQLEDRTLLAVSFSFNYIGGNSIGFNHPTEGPIYKAMLEGAAATMGSWFDHTATITVDVSSLNQNGLAAAGPNFNFGSFSSGFDNLPAPISKIQGQGDNNGSVVDMVMNVAFARPTNSPWSLDLTPESNQYDFTMVIMHELMHGLNFVGAITQSGGSIIGGGANR